MMILRLKTRLFYSTGTKSMPINQHSFYHNYYKILNVHPDASSEQIKRRYYELAKIYHPDTFGDKENSDLGDKENRKNEQKTIRQILGISKENQKQDKLLFQDINEAYQTLGNYNKRLEYDRSLNFRSFSYVDPKRYNTRQNSSSYQQYEQQYQQKSQKYQSFHQKANSRSYSRYTADMTMDPLVQKKAQALSLVIKLFLSVGVIYFTHRYFFFYTPMTQHEIRRNNLILSKENIDSSPTVIERRKLQYAKQMIDKKITANVIELKVRGAGEQSTKKKQTRTQGITSIAGVKKQKIAAAHQENILNPNRLQYM